MGLSSSLYCNHICDCQSVKALTDFCQNYKSSQLCFIVDQMNALDPEPKGEDNFSNEAKFLLHSLLLCMSLGHVYILSILANHKSAKYMVVILVTKKSLY